MWEGIDRIFCRCGGKGLAGGLFGSQQLPFPCGEANFFSGLCAGEASRWGGGPSLPSAALDVPFSGREQTKCCLSRGWGEAAGGFLAPSFGGETRNKRLFPAQETLFAGGGVGRTVPLWGEGDRRCGKAALWRAARPGGNFLFRVGRPLGEEGRTCKGWAWTGRRGHLDGEEFCRRGAVLPQSMGRGRRPAAGEAALCRGRDPHPSPRDEGGWR